ncbi:MAG: hypothetical protein ACK4UT_05710 [Moraxellaceae bacterium]
MSTAQMVSSAGVADAVVGRSFVLGLPDREGLYRVGLERNVWKIPAGSYQSGDRVVVVSVADNDVLAVEKARN